MYRRILLAYDGSAASESALTETIRVAGAAGAKVRLLHVVSHVTIATGIEVDGRHLAMAAESTRLTGERVAAEGVQRLRAAGIDAQAAVVDSYDTPLAHLVVEDARRWQADLVVIGTHGRRGLRRVLLGSDAEEILRRARTPVLLVRLADPAADTAAGKASGPAADAASDAAPDPSAGLATDAAGAAAGAAGERR
ncbi:MAG: universal stress protein [Lautropia sp.]